MRLVYEGGDVPRLCIPEYGKARIATDTDGGIWLECFEDRSHLEDALHQFEWKTDVLNQRASIETRNVQSLDLVADLRNLFHFHSSLSAHEQQFCLWVDFPECVCDRNCGKNMSACTASSYDYPFCQYQFIFFRLVLLPGQPPVPSLRFSLHLI